MENYTCKSPVAMIFFNRPDTTKEVLDAIRVAKPSKMYLISDAPRAGRADDEELRKCHTPAGLLLRTQHG